MIIVMTMLLVIMVMIVIVVLPLYELVELASEFTSVAPSERTSIKELR